MKEFLKSIEFKIEIKPCEVFKSIDEIKNDEEKTEKIVKSFENLGFLHKIDDDRKADCAIAMAQFSTFMIFSMDKDSHDEVFETCTFPIINRLFKYTDAWHLWSTKKFTEIIYGKNFGKYVDKITFSTQEDGEAVLSKVFTDELEKKLKDDSYDFDRGIEKRFEEYISKFNKQVEVDSTQNHPNHHCVKVNGILFEVPVYMCVKEGKLYNNNTKRFEGVEGDVVTVTEFGKAIRGHVKGYTDFQFIPIEGKENPIVVSAIGIRDGTSKIEFEHLVEIEEA